jgi:hypothetical protein
MSKDNKKEEALKKLIGDKSNIRQEYGSYMSHYHCWHQNQYPACGIPLENHKQYHKQCCLCDTPSPTPSNKEEKCQHEIESNMCEPYCRKCKISLPSTPNQTKAGRAEVQAKDRKVKAHYNLLRSKERLYAIEREMLE